MKEEEEKEKEKDRKRGKQNKEKKTLTFFKDLLCVWARLQHSPVAYNSALAFTSCVP